MASGRKPTGFIGSYVVECDARANVRDERSSSSVAQQEPSRVIHSRAENLDVALHRSMTDQAARKQAKREPDRVREEIAQIKSAPWDEALRTFFDEHDRTKPERRGAHGEAADPYIAAEAVVGGEAEPEGKDRVKSLVPQGNGMGPLNQEAEGSRVGKRDDEQDERDVESG